MLDSDVNEIKEWYALAAYLEHCGRDGIPAGYAQPDGRKTVSTRWSPAELTQNLNWISGVVLAVLLLLIALAVLLFRVLRRRKRKA